jgi:dTDP-4-amino-4,6-dideoxygalactose transaminase
VWHLYTVRTARPELLAEYLSSLGIATGRHYPEPPHLSRAYRVLGLGRGDFPITEALAEQLLSLPIFPGMTDQQLTTVNSAVRGFFVHG